MLSLLAAALIESASPQFVAKHCEAAMPARVRCGSIIVPEDRSRPAGRKIGLNVVIVPATNPGSEPRALFDLEGGPGLADTKNAAFYLSDGAAYAASEDVVLLDQRGTGGSNPLDCPEFDEADHALQPMFPATAVRSCRARLQRQADLTKYTTTDAVADLDATRRALGYQRIDLIALSYGTTVALRYIAEHGENVRSAVLLSAVPTAARPPRHHAAAAQKALEQLFADCRADQACNTKFPDVRSDLTVAVRKLRSSDRTPSEVAMERLRTKMYSPLGYRELPSIIRRLAKGDENVLRSTNERAAFNYFDGVYLTITCSESLPWFSKVEATRDARKTLFGDYRLARQYAACANWPRARVQPAFFAPIRSPVPVLLLSGQRDPVAPPIWAKSLLRDLPNSRQIVIRAAGHIVDGLSQLDTCYDLQVLRFISAADPKVVEAGCFASMEAPPFKLD